MSISRNPQIALIDYSAARISTNVGESNYFRFFHSSLDALNSRALKEGKAMHEVFFSL